MKIVFATNNQHKLSEIRSILGDSIEVLSLKDIGCDVDIPETGTTKYTLASVCASTPCVASTTKTAPSHAAKERDTS